ncbi:VIT1/CCC1 transporter family protein [Granulosicoccus sp. 3-233]|uniref:VIT1/CCC1 transporter family protein n=1 Tax=Granulosicoccus sp. 3-233 TaxID=3417969 RepID=UPI003D33EA64
MILKRLLKHSIEHGHSQSEIESRLGSSDEKPNHLRDAIYGGIDGAVTTFAIVAGVEGAGFDRNIIIALGVANVLADGFSMAASNYSGIKADSEQVSRLRAMERQHIKSFPAGERLEIRTILKRKGLQGEQLEEAVRVMTSHEGLWLDMMLVEEHGVSPVPATPVRASMVTFAAFVVCGDIPLTPFVLNTADPFSQAIIATGVTFVLIGSLKSRWSQAPWWKSALQTLAIGGLAAVIAWSAAVFVTSLGA